MPLEPAKLPRIPKLSQSTKASNVSKAVPHVPVVRVGPHLVFGVQAGWCIVTCPVCDTDGAGFVQEDVHALPPARYTCCAYGHEYRIKLQPLLDA
jgi:hypothetical protein